MMRIDPVILSTDTTITLEESIRTLPFNLMGEKGTIIDTLSSPPQPQLGGGKARYPDVSKIYGHGRARDFIPDCLSLHFAMKASDLGTKKVTDTVKSLTIRTLDLFGGSVLSSHTDWTNGHCEVEIKLARTPDSLEAAHQTIAFLNDPQYGMVKQLSL